MQLSASTFTMASIRSNYMNSDENLIKNVHNLKNIMEQIIALRNKNKICKIYTNSSYNKVKFDNFVEYEGHFLELNISITNDLKITIQSHSLPDKLTDDDTNSTENSIFTHCNTLNGYFMQFCKLLQQFELFYKYMSNLDDLCYIVEPPVITTKHNWRIFKLNDKVFIKITVNQFCPSSVMVNLYGPTNDVEIYRNMFNDNGNNWDIEIDIYNNLLRIFDLMYFPMKENDCKNNEDDEQYCNICYSYLLDDHVPICSCDNSKCNLIFHVVCLKEWFSRLTMDGKTFLTVTIGSCPFCKEKLSASFKTLLDG